MSSSMRGLLIYASRLMSSYEDDHSMCDFERREQKVAEQKRSESGSDITIGERSFANRQPEAVPEQAARTRLAMLMTSEYSTQ